jgi:hypothetical protein
MDNPKPTLRSKLYEIANSMLAACLFAGVSVIAATLYSRFGPVWARPIMNGLITGVVVFALFLCMRAILALPVARARISPENVGDFVLGWLHKFNLEVKGLQDDDCYFLYKVTTDGGKVVTIRRSRKTYSDHLTFRALITLSDAEKAEFESFTEHEKIALKLQIQLELSRAIMGYKTDGWLVEDVWLFKHVPISPTLNEETMINTIWEMEAMVTTLFATGALAISAHRDLHKTTVIEAAP